MSEILTVEFQPYIDRAINLLGKKRHEVIVLAANWAGVSSPFYLFRDACEIEEYSLDEHGHIIFTNWTKTFKAGYHLTKYITPNQHTFCMVAIGTYNSNYDFLILPKEKLAFLILEARRYNKVKNKQELIVPILEQSFIDEILNDSVFFIRNSKRNKRLKLKLSRGLILTGLPGNGKTMMCRYIKKLAENYSLSAGIYTAAHLNNGFQKGTLPDMLKAYNVIFFDDIDINYFNRKTNGEMACALLNAMDGLDDAKSCVRIFSTNESVDSIDSAFCRPGRIDKIYKFEPPTDVLRARFIDTWNKEILEVISKESLSKYTTGFSFAEMEEVRNQLLLQHITGQTMTLENIILFSKEVKGKKKKVGFQ